MGSKLKLSKTILESLSLQLPNFPWKDGQRKGPRGLSFAADLYVPKKEKKGFALRLIIESSNPQKKTRPLFKLRVSVVGIFDTTEPMPEGNRDVKSVIERATPILYEAVREMLTSVFSTPVLKDYPLPKALPKKTGRIPAR
jgi:preprotein translocase subunit SecB